ncbi:inactive serine protease 54 isoform X2 [Castor canadensis]|uniref:Inactive serine protease 54 isoform X2 n=1 Tax=Castor canadensis TaxID=51338 RepID=A0AC58L2T5_CASCN
MAEMRGMLLVLLYVSHSSANCGNQKASLVDPSEENLVSSTEFPWVVSVQDMQYAHLAFGCILSKFWVLSIASAFQHRPAAIIVVGIANMDSKKIAHKEYPVNTIIIHEDFNNYSMSNNLALLKTDTAMHFDDLVRSICFLDRKLSMSPVLENCWVSGWNPTSATGNHMTMSILRRISVKDIDRCPLPKPRKTGCGSHTQQETDAVCLGEPGSPMMCQLQELNLWVLRGILTKGGNACPGLFLYTRVEEYSDWIMSKAKRAGPSLTPLHPWEKMIPILYYKSQTVITQSMRSETDHMEWTQSSSQGQKRSTFHLRLVNGSRDGQNFRVKGLQESDRTVQEAIQPMYYDYYGGESEEAGSVAGQNRLHQPQEMSLLFFVLVFFGSGV